MNRTRLSLHYLYSYLIVIGLALLFFPKEGLRLLLSNGDYGDIMPRFAGMLMAGLGMNIFGIVLSRAQALYPRTLLVRAFFLVCIITFYATTRDPFFLVLLAVVGFGFVWTGLSYLSEKN
jgi:hypothetical protein